MNKVKLTAGAGVLAATLLVGAVPAGAGAQPADSSELTSGQEAQPSIALVGGTGDTVQTVIEQALDTYPASQVASVLEAMAVASTAGHPANFPGIGAPADKEQSESEATLLSELAAGVRAGVIPTDIGNLDSRAATERPDGANRPV